MSHKFERLSAILLAPASIGQDRPEALDGGHDTIACTRGHAIAGRVVALLVPRDVHEVPGGGLRPVFPNLIRPIGDRWEAPFAEQLPDALSCMLFEAAFRNRRNDPMPFLSPPECLGRTHPRRAEPEEEEERWQG